MSRRCSASWGAEKQQPVAVRHLAQRLGERARVLVAIVGLGRQRRRQHVVERASAGPCRFSDGGTIGWP